MEEPPKIERIIASQGISLSDTATILTAYLSNIDQYHHSHGTPTLADDEGDENAVATSQDFIDKKTYDAPRKSRQEREEEALIAQMDQLVKKKSSAGMISDDVYERLKMITMSICAEVEGKPFSASGAAAASRKDKDASKSSNSELLGGEESNGNDGADDFLAELEEAERLEKQEEQQQQPQQVEKSKRDKKKEKKAKKAAKKAKKKEKRKSREMGDAGDGNALKKIKVEK